MNHRVPCIAARAATILALAATCAVAQAADAGSSTAGSDATLPLQVTDVDREDVVSLAMRPVTAQDVADGLFPEDRETPEQRQLRERCERILAAGFICMPPQRSYTRFTLPALKFAFGSASLPDEARLALRAFSDALKGRSAGAPAVRIEGHADAVGDPVANKALSERRAAAVRDFLVSQGVSKSLFAVEGYGAEQPLKGVSPTAPENRRVDIRRNTADVRAR
jgi:outer membrane protein OmpA-like peptidoglycan-associated protein